MQQSDWQYPQGQSRAIAPNPQTIAQWLSTKLPPWQITVQVQIQNHILQVILESSQVLNQSWTVDWMEQHLASLELPGIVAITLFAHQAGATSPTWSQTLSWQPPPQKLSHLRELANQGNRQAMTLLLNRALIHKQITALVSYADQHLDICLEGESVSEQTIYLMLVVRELHYWQRLDWQILTISGQSQPAIAADWQQSLDRDHLPEIIVTSSQVGNVNSSEPRNQNLNLVKPNPTGLSISPTLHKNKLGIPVQEIDRQTWQVLAVSVVLALLLMASPQVTFLLSPLIILVHELGHAFTAWIFGYPAIPAFDFVYGGGITLHGDRWSGLVILAYIGMGYLLWIYRYNRLTCRFLWGIIGVYSLCAFTPIHKFLFVAMGHGFELLFAGIFLYRALSGFGCRAAIERPLYGMLAFFTVFFASRFAWGLIFNPITRANYEVGKGGILDNDFVRLSRDYFHLDLGTIAGSFLALAIVTPLMAFTLYRHRYLMLYTCARLFQVKAD